MRKTFLGVLFVLTVGCQASRPVSTGSGAPGDQRESADVDLPEDLVLRLDGMTPSELVRTLAVTSIGLKLKNPAADVFNLDRKYSLSCSDICHIERK